MTFSSIGALEAALVAAATKAVAQVEKEVYGTFDANLMQYYGEFTPAEYIRTYALDNSLQRSGVHSSGNGASAEVYFTTPSYSTGTWSGEKVLNVALEDSMPHGHAAGGTPVWSVSMAELGDIKGKLLNAVKSAL